MRAPEPLPLDLAHDLRANLFEHGRVERTLFAGELADLVGLDLLGKVLGHFALRAAQNEGVNRGAKAVGRFLIAGVDRSRVALLELVERPEKARADEVEDRPDLGETIFDRRTRERELAIGLEPLGRARRRRERVLDVLRFVQDDVAPVELREELLVATEKRVARDDDLRVFELVLPLLSLGAMPELVLERRRELVHLA